MADFWTGRKVFVTGGHGFLGSRIVADLRSRGADVLAPSHIELDLLDSHEVLNFVFRNLPTLVIHCAGVVGGIGYNIVNPARLIRENVQMGLNLFEACKEFPGAIQKVVCIGSACSYPEAAPNPVSEEQFWIGYPEPTNGPYGIAKRVLFDLCQSYYKQHGLRSNYLVLANLYGPGCRFDANSHVIPALIGKVDQAIRDGESEIKIFGTGKPEREFLYIQDASDAVIESSENLDYKLPLNIGTGKKVSILDLAQMIISSMSPGLRIETDPSRPDGHPGRVLDLRKMESLLSFRPQVGLQDGVRNTIAWFKEIRVPS